MGQRRRAVAFALVPAAVGFALLPAMAACGMLITVPNRQYDSPGPDAPGGGSESGPGLDSADEDASLGDDEPDAQEARDDAAGDGGERDTGLDGNASDNGIVGEGKDATDASDEPSQVPSPITANPEHLRLWLTADHGVACASGRVTAWADQSGRADNATTNLGQQGPACNVGHIAHGVELPFFSGPSPDGGAPNVVDQTLDVDLGFLAGSNYTIFAVERRWADYPANDWSHYEIILGTNVPDENAVSSAQCGGNGGFPHQGVLFGYVYYADAGQLSSDHICSAVSAPVSPVGVLPPAPLTIDAVVFDATWGREIFQNGSALVSVPDQTPAAQAIGGAIGRGAAHTLDAGIDGRFRGDIAEIVAYDTALSSADFAGVHAYLAKHWGLP